MIKIKAALKESLVLDGNYRFYFAGELRFSNEGTLYYEVPKGENLLKSITEALRFLDHSEIKSIEIYGE
jgi:hypothetical protein